MLWNSKDIIICGRSIGSGPACHLAARNPDLGALALISPYKSIASIVQDSFGSFGFLSKLVKERFVNIEEMANIRSPTFFLHGKKDKLIPYQHSKDLKKACKGETFAHFPKTMDHNEFSFMYDLVEPLKYFLLKQ